MAEQVITFHRQRPLPDNSPPGRLAAAGLFLRRHRRAILTIQWMVVVVTPCSSWSLP